MSVREFSDACIAFLRRAAFWYWSSAVFASLSIGAVSLLTFDRSHATRFIGDVLIALNVLHWAPAMLTLLSERRRTAYYLLLLVLLVVLIPAPALIPVLIAKAVGVASLCLLANYGSAALRHGVKV
jgi:hypothetical protein